MIEEERLVSPREINEDGNNTGLPVNLRPTCLADFVGQKQVCENLKDQIFKYIDDITSVEK